MLRLTSLANKYQRRTLRVLYGQTQAYPYDAQLDATFVRTGGAIEGTATTGITGAKAAILPGQVAVWSGLEKVNTVAHAWAAATYDYRAAGLFANFVGGELTDFPSEFDRVGVWRGVGSVYEVLAPAFDDTNLSADSAAIDGTAAAEVYLTANVKSQLSTLGAGAWLVEGTPNAPQTARLLNRLSSSALVVELLV